MVVGSCYCSVDVAGVCYSVVGAALYLSRFVDFAVCSLFGSALVDDAAVDVENLTPAAVSADSTHGAVVAAAVVHGVENSRPLSSRPDLG